MPNGRSPTLGALEATSRAAWHAQQAPANGVVAMPAMPLMLTIRPRRAGIMSGRALPRVVDQRNPFPQHRLVDPVGHEARDFRLRGDGHFAQAAAQGPGPCLRIRIRILRACKLAVMSERDDRSKACGGQCDSMAAHRRCLKDRRSGPRSRPPLTPGWRACAGWNPGRECPRRCRVRGYLEQLCRHLDRTGKGAICLHGPCPPPTSGPWPTVPLGQERRAPDGGETDAGS